MKVRHWRLLLLGVIICITRGDASAQQLPSVVQLPSFQVFSYSGSVMVPDSGAAYLGGNNVSSSSFRRRGLSRSFGFAQRMPQASIRAQIIDHDQIDRQLLGGSKQEFLNSDRGKPAATVADKAGGRRPVSSTEEGKALVRHARQQVQQGDRTGAFDTYRMAISVLDGRLEHLATVEFRRVFGNAADQALRMASLRR